jgi:hypothetical protein
VWLQNIDSKDFGSKFFGLNNLRAKRGNKEERQGKKT